MSIACLATFLADPGAELLFFVSASMAVLNILYGGQILVGLRTGGGTRRILSALLNCLAGVMLIGQVYAFGLTGLEAISVEFIGKDRFIYFWIAGMILAWVLVYPRYRLRLSELGIYSLLGRGR
jgi:hypothetical protein